MPPGTRTTVLVLLTIGLITLAVGEINRFDNPGEWRLVGNAELVDDGLKLTGGSQAIADYEDVTPDLIELTISPGSGGDHRIAFKGDYRPVIAISCSREVLTVNEEEFEKSEDRCEVELEPDWDNHSISSVNLNGEEHSTTIGFQNERGAINRTRIYQPSGTREATYLFTTTGDEITTEIQVEENGQESGLIQFIISLIPFI